MIGQHARQTFQQVQGAGAPADPIPETERPLIHRGARRPKVRVLPAVGDSVRDEYVYLKRDVKNAPRVYRRVPNSQKKTININFGHVLFGIRLERVPHSKTPLYREPPSEDGIRHMVAIKKVSKNKVRNYLERGGHENPYTAIHRMQTIGDDIHVLSCIEALEDDKYLYTIMRYCEGRSIMDLVPWHSTAGVNEQAARECIHKVSQNIHYLQSLGIVHHDLSPDNILSLDGRLVLVDLAMSLRVPNGPDNRCLLTPQGAYGKFPYMPPEVFVSGGPFDGYSMDVWSCGCILYNLLTSYHLYKLPHPSDVMFRYFLMAGALSNEPINERTVEVMADVFHTRQDQEDRQNLLSRAMAHLHLSSESMDLLQQTLQLRPHQRNTLAQILESTWMTEGPL